jgi:ribonuclease P protein component
VKQSFRIAERVRIRRDFERAYNEGARIHGRFMLVFVLPNGGTVPRLGVSATRKLGSAVERNRVKRLARELFRRRKLDAGVDIIVVPRREMLDAPFASLEADYHAVLDRRHSARPGGGSRRPGGRSRTGGNTRV